MTNVFRLSNILIVIFLISTIIACGDQGDFVEIKNGPEIITPMFETVDGIYPEITLAPEKSIFIQGENIPFSWNSTKGAQKYEILINDDSGLQKWATTQNFEYNSNENEIYNTQGYAFKAKKTPYTWTVRAVNFYQFYPSKQICYFYIKEVNGPNISIITPSNGSSNTQIITLTGTATDDTEISSISYKIDDGEDIPITMEAGTEVNFSENINCMTPGEHTITVTSIDYFGNTSTSKVTFNIEQSLPQINLTTPTEGFSTTENTLTLHIKCWRP